MIPPVLHFIWINDRDFDEGEYVGIMTALKNTSYDIVLHTNVKPGLKYDPYSIVNPRFRIVFTEFPIGNSIEGVTLPVALVSDIYRVNILHKFGGMYSDLDILWFKDLPVDLSSLNLLGTYDLESYRHLTNSFMGCAKGYDGFIKLNNMVIEYLKSRNGANMTKGKKNYFSIYKIQCEFIKREADYILPQRIINKNTHARIGRVIRSEDKLRVVEYAFNWYNSMYKFEDIKRILPL